ncbi:putative membrane protein yuid [Fagus crenata]
MGREAALEECYLSLFGKLTTKPFNHRAARDTMKKVWRMSYEQQAGRERGSRICKYLFGDDPKGPSKQAKYLRVRVEVLVDKPLRPGGFVSSTGSGKIWVDYRATFWGKEVRTRSWGEKGGNALPESTPVTEKKGILKLMKVQQTLGGVLTKLALFDESRIGGEGGNGDVSDLLMIDKRASFMQEEGANLMESGHLVAQEKDTIELLEVYMEDHVNSDALQIIKGHDIGAHTKWKLRGFTRKLRNNKDSQENTQSTMGDKRERDDNNDLNVQLSTCKKKL